MATDFFLFETDFVDSLRCIPMQVRYNLDTSGIKLKLSHWHQFSPEQRQTLVALPCSTADEVEHYRQTLKTWVRQRTETEVSELTIDQNPPWMDETALPESVQAKAEETGVTIGLEQWQKLTPLQRFVLIKLSRPSHENHNFLPALQEFEIVEPEKVGPES